MESKYKKYIIKAILFIFILDKIIRVFNYLYYYFNINISALSEVLSILAMIFVAIPVTILIIEFLFKE